MADGTCLIPGCIRPLLARGWCEMHYTRQRRHGDPLIQGKPYMRGTVEERFWAKVGKGSGCWLWTGGMQGTGYGYFAKRHGDMVLAHRFAYELLVGPIPEGLQLDHLCRARACVRPSHLEPVTQRENLRRGQHAGRNKTHCKRGHLFDEANTRIRRDGSRLCLQCARERRAPVSLV